jgi:predicted dehydrogenase
MPINVGFVGLSQTGWASSVLAPTMLENSKYAVNALCTTSKNSATVAAAKISAIIGRDVTPYWGGTEQISKDPNVDLVVVAVKSPSHEQAIGPVIQAGKNFFIEWPAGASLRETVQIAEAARLKGLRTMVGLQGRHSTVINKVKDIIGSGKIGRVLSSSVIALAPREAHFWGPEVSETNIHTVMPNSGSSMLDIAVGHHLDVFTYVLGDFSSVAATMSTAYPTATVMHADGTTGEQFPNTNPDHIAFTGTLQSGAIASVSWRGGYSSSGRQKLVWEIDGESGSIRMTNDHPSGAFTHIFNPDLYVNGELVAVEGTDFLFNIAAGWEEYAKGPEGNYASMDDAVRIHTVLHAIEVSNREGRRVEL